MNLKLIKWQALLIGLLSLSLAAEWGYGRYAWRRLQQNLQANHVESVALPELPAIAAPKTAVDAYGEMVDRPLFIQGRKPPPETAPSDKPQNVEAGQIDDWLLIGVYGKDHKPTMALFAKKNEPKKYLKLRAEQTISGWRLQEIKPDRVILNQAGQQKSVLLRKPRAENKPPVLQPKPALPFPFPPKPNNPDPENANHDSETN